MSLLFSANDTLDRAAIMRRGREVIRLETEALAQLELALDDGFIAACDLIFSANRRIVVTGMGKSGHIARKIAATFASTGTPAFFVHAAEASHGDLGMITPDDVIIALSWSGETVELKNLINYSRRFRIGLVAVTSDSESTLAKAADVAGKRRLGCATRLRTGSARRDQPRRRPAGHRGQGLGPLADVRDDQRQPRSTW